MSMADRIAVMSEGRVEQVDTPVDLYQQPATVFVAGFVGSSNTFAGTRTPTGVDVPDVGLLPGRAVGPTDSAEAVLVVRPEDVRLVDATAGLVSGLVIDTQFYGGRSTIAVEIAGHEVPITLSCQGTADVTRGTAVHLAWPPDKGVVLTPRD